MKFEIKSWKDAQWNWDAQDILTILFGLQAVLAIGGTIALLIWF